MNVSQEIIDELRSFANEHGRSWRSKLRRLWDAGGDTGLLRQARNVIGPSGLDKIQFNLPVQDTAKNEKLEGKYLA